MTRQASCRLRRDCFLPDSSNRTKAFRDHEKCIVAFVAANRDIVENAYLQVIPSKQPRLLPCPA